MNSRIKELIDQATFHKDRYALPDEFAEKFAELLLQECVDACWRANKIGYSVPPTQQQVALDCVREIETALRS